ncbi:MAG: NAD(P)-dependent oxidoreductase [SAR324 cluster bacterium]|nr:NAD(P)-dependent oxidoreductase [SAR324 cluster bacterium]MBL7034563.1 NAD(P)-dependent oxidoreductase [SAR324 cluster bacterium]
MNTIDVRCGRLSQEELSANFSDAHPPLKAGNAIIEASRCYFCYDAPCVEACPTSIDIPNFIRKITTGNLKGSANDILAQNIMGGMCARVCPTEILCEGACVRETQEHQPVRIGELQRYATDWFFESGETIFEREKATGKRIAVIGGGPAGLSCAHKLAVSGHEVVVFEAREKLSGLNEYGIAAYKTVNNFAQREVDFILKLGGIETRTNQKLGQDIQLNDIRKEYDAVFLSLGLGDVNSLGLENEELDGVFDAVETIAELRQSGNLSKIAVGRRVVVIGGGNTAIDIAVQIKKLGAEDVTLAYRRGPEQMSATWKEQEFAQTNGVRVKHWVAPTRLQSENGHVCGIEFECTELNPEGKLTGTGEIRLMEADVVFKAIGQTLQETIFSASEMPKLEGGKIAINTDYETSLAGVWAGGDCVRSGEDLTVQAVEDGKQAALSINRKLQ